MRAYMFDEIYRMSDAERSELRKRFREEDVKPKTQGLDAEQVEKIMKDAATYQRYRKENFRRV